MKMKILGNAIPELKW